MLQQTQLISLLDRAMNQTARIRKGHEAVYFCPFCNHYKKKLEVNVETGDWQCWVCHVSGHSIRSLFIKLQVNQSYFAELSKLGVNFYKPRTSEEEQLEIRSLPKEFLSLSDHFSHKLAANQLEVGNALWYLKSRGITKEDIIRYNIGFCEYGEYRQRIIVPSYDRNGCLNFFSARAYYETNPMKYKLPPWSKDIIGFELFINWEEPITLTEGQFDAIAIRNNAIPLFGTTISDLLREAILENGVERINIVLDNDAIKSAMKIWDNIESLKAHDIAIHLIQLEGKDPSALGFRKINKIIKDSRPFEYSDMIRLRMTV